MSVSGLMIVCCLTAGGLLAQERISGTITRPDGRPLHFVFVGNIAAGVGAFSDSSGRFVLRAPAATSLQFQCAGFKDTVVAAAGNLNVVMHPATGSAANAALTLPVAGNGSADAHLSSLSEGGIIGPGHQNGKLRGSQYWFQTFVHGFIVQPSGHILYEPGSMFDYDKLSGALLFSADGHQVKEVAPDDVRMFTLVGGDDHRLDFERVPEIDPSHYLQVLAAGPRYTILKLVKTRFVKADYVNNGMTAHGNDYDEYVDDAEYYLLSNGSHPQKLTLRKKPLKSAFGTDANKAESFFSKNSGSIDDAYLSRLGAYMNE